jgi:Putative abortive phage resistance protein AbiGi, antitoxin
MRQIEDILGFRSDFSPFLTHLTRTVDDRSAKENLLNILKQGALKAGKTTHSASYGAPYHELGDEALRRFFSAVSFTETPLNEIHCFLEIQGRKTNLEQYGLVFLRDRLEADGVSPVLYLNNKLDDKTSVIRGLCKLIETDAETAEQILPLISFFGAKVPPLTSGSSQQGEIDFRWEREWRYPASRGDFSFSPDDVFVGLCPHDEIKDFEIIYPGVSFVDPMRNIKWYATKLIAARQRMDIKCSVV